MKWLRRLFYLIVVLVLIGAPAYYWLIVESHIPSEGSYAIELGEVRRLAGDTYYRTYYGPSEIRVETVANFSFPKTAVVAGDGWDPTDMPVSSYQLVYGSGSSYGNNPDYTANPTWANKTAIIDTALDEATGREAGVTTFDTESYRRMSVGLSGASLVVITHEHMDHIGGLVAQGDLPERLRFVRLTREQINHPERMSPVKWPKGALTGYKPLEYNRYTPIAPGVVLIKARGHSPGSQMVYVRLNDGREILFLGDVAWHRRNIDIQRQRARLVSWLFLSEERDTVMLQLVELKRLSTKEPNLNIMPGHDSEALNQFLSAGLLVRGFK